MLKNNSISTYNSQDLCEIQSYVVECQNNIFCCLCMRSPKIGCLFMRSPKISCLPLHNISNVIFVSFCTLQLFGSRILFDAFFSTDVWKEKQYEKAGMKTPPIKRSHRSEEMSSISAQQQVNKWLFAFFYRNWTNSFWILLHWSLVIVIIGDN